MGNQVSHRATILGTILRGIRENNLELLILFKPLALTICKFSFILFKAKSLTLIHLKLYWFDLAPAATAVVRWTDQFLTKVLVWFLSAYPKWAPIILYYSAINFIFLPIFLPIVFLYDIFLLLLLMPNYQLITLIYNNNINIIFLRFYIINLVFILTHSLPFIDRIKHFIIVSTVIDDQTFIKNCHLLVSKRNFLDSVQRGEADVCPICQDTFLPTQVQAYWINY